MNGERRNLNCVGCLGEWAQQRQAEQKARRRERRRVKNPAVRKVRAPDADRQYAKRWYEKNRDRKIAYTEAQRSAPLKESKAHMILRMLGRRTSGG